MRRSNNLTTKASGANRNADGTKRIPVLKKWQRSSQLDPNTLITPRMPRNADGTKRTYADSHDHTAEDLQMRIKLARELSKDMIRKLAQSITKV